MFDFLIQVSVLDRVLARLQADRKVENYKTFVNSWGAIISFVQSEHDQNELIEKIVQLAHEELYKADAKEEEGLKRPIDTIEIFTKEEREEDALYDAILSGRYEPAKRRRLESWFAKQKKRERNVPVIVFYSYKGGVGRTTSLVFSALKLAEMGKRVAIIDFDLEAPGIDSLLSQTQPSRGVIDYLIEKPYLKDKVVMDDYIYRSNLRFVNELDAGDVYVMPAGKVDSYYIEKLSHIDFDSLTEEDDLLESLVDDVASSTKADIIFVDSRTGINEIGGSLFFYLADAICTVFQNNEQNQEGIKVLMKHLKDQEKYVDANLLWIHNMIGESNPEADKIYKQEIREQIYTMDPNKYHDYGSRYFEIPRLYDLERLNREFFFTERFKDISDSEFKKMTLLLKSYIRKDRIDDEIAHKILKSLIQDELRKAFYDTYFYPVGKFKDIDNHNIVLVGQRGSGKKTLSYFLEKGKYSIATQKNDIVVVDLTQADLIDFYQDIDLIEEKLLLKLDEKDIDDEINKMLKNRIKNHELFHSERYSEPTMILRYITDSFKGEYFDKLLILALAYGFYFHIVIMQADIYGEDNVLSLAKMYFAKYQRFVPNEDKLKRKVKAVDIVKAMYAREYELTSSFTMVPPNLISLSKWDKLDLYTILTKRFLNMSDILRNKLEEDYPDEFEKICRHDQTFGYIPNPDENVLRYIITEIFGEKVTPKSSNLTYDWLYNRLKADNRAVPGAILEFAARVLTKIKEKVSNDPDFYTKHSSYLPLSALTPEELEDCLRDI